MLSSATFRLLHFTGFISLSAIAALSLLQPAHADNQVPAIELRPSTLPNPQQDGQRINPNQVPLKPDIPSTLPKPQQDGQPIDPNLLRPLSQDSSILSKEGGQKLMTEAGNAISAQNYVLATQKFQEARQVFNQLSNFYQQLAGIFSGIDNRISDELRRKALDTAQMRDEATYKLALVHRAQNQPELAVPLLIQIIASQNPTRDLGKKAYQQLFELGFVDSPFPRPRSDSSSTQPSTTPSSSPSTSTPAPR